MFVNDDEGKSWSTTQSLIADADGAFLTEFRLPDRFVAAYTITATGDLSGQAEWHFTDSVATGDDSTGNNGWLFPGSEITLSTPATAAGRLLLAQIAVIGLTSSQVICTPAGWTSPASGRVNNGSGVSSQVFYRVATGSESASYTWQFRTSAGNCGSSSGTISAGATGAITSYSGVDTAAPIRSIASNTGTSSSLLAPSINSIPAGDIVVRQFASANAGTISTASTSSSGVPNSQVYSANRNWFNFLIAAPTIAAADADQPTTAATGSLAASSGGSAAWVAQTIVLRKLAPTITLTIGDTSAQFGSNLTPDGASSNSTDTVVAHVAGGNPSVGACYSWASSVTVASSTGYRIAVSATPANPHLDLVNASPGGYAACTNGEPVGPNMFPSATPAGTWISGQSATTGRSHPFGLGLDVRWDVAPSATLGNSTLTFTAIAQ